MPTVTRYVAFLRGINVGGHNLLKMKDLVERFESLGFDNVSSYKASGNILFDAVGKNSPDAVCKKIEKALGVKVALRSVPELKQLVKLEPFKKIRKSRATKAGTAIRLISWKRRIRSRQQRGIGQPSKG